MRWALIVVIGVLAGFAATAKASLLAYEGFNYPPGPLEGQSGGGSFGFSGPWYPYVAGQQNYTIAQTSLSDPSGVLATSGGRCDNTNVTGDPHTVQRNLLQPIGHDGTTRYISFVGRFLYDPIEFNVLTPDMLYFEEAGPSISMGRLPGSANNWGMLAAQPEPPYSAGEVSEFLPQPDQPVLVVVKAQFMSGADLFTLYLNPTPGAMEPSVAAGTINFDLGLVGTISLFGDDRFSIDEIRIGETFADVTPVPEPGGLIGTCSVCAALLARRRRRT